MKDAFKLLFLLAFSCGGEFDAIPMQADSGPKPEASVPIPIWMQPPSKNGTSLGGAPRNPVSDPPLNDNGLEPHPMTGEDKIIWTRPPKPEGPN